MQTVCIYMATVNYEDYIGRTNNFERRKNAHLSAPPDNKFHKAIHLNGRDAVQWWILEDDIPKELGPKREEYWISYYNTYNKGLNSSPKGQGVVTHTEEARRKLSDSHTGKKMSEESRKKMSDSHTGMTHSKESKQKMSDIKKGEKAYWYGRKLSEETKQKMSDIKKGHKHSEESKRKISESMKKYWKEKNAKTDTN